MTMLDQNLSPAMKALHNRIDLVSVPFTDRGTRLLIFVRGPEMSIRMAERWSKWEAEYGHYRQRVPIIERFQFTDEQGNALPLTSDTYPHAIQLTNSIGAFALTFIDPETLLMRLPQGTFGLEFTVMAADAHADRRGATFHGKRNVSYTTNADILSNEVTQESTERWRVRLRLRAEEGAPLLLNITPRLAFNRSLPHVEHSFEAALYRWQEWFDHVPDVLPEYRDQYLYAWWVMRSGLMNTRYYFTREAMTPSKIHYVGVWQWDQYFHALAYRHVDAKLAEDQLRIVFDHQRPDGMLPDAIYDEGLVTRLEKPVAADVTKPPLAGWVALKLYESSGRLDFLEEIYDALLLWHDWWLKHNSAENGLCQYYHPFSSGLDDSPLWDEGMPVIAPDLNTYLCLQAESIARIADMIGEPEMSTRMRASADRFAALMIEHLWSDERGLFEALHEGEPVDVTTLFNLLPLCTGRLPDVIVERMLPLLTDPGAFWTEFPLATVSLRDDKFDPQQMWRGPVWANINYLFIEALFRVGKPELARRLRRETLAMIQRLPDIYEYYNPLNGSNPPKAAPIFGWTSAVFIDLALQETREREST
jgi:hypothetical protein